LFRATLFIDQATDVDGLILDFRKRCSRANLPDAKRDVLLEQVVATVRQLADHGREVTTVGGSLNLTRTIKDNGYSVEIRVGFGRRPSLIHRLFRSLRG